MKAESFRAWLLAQDQATSSASTRVADARRVETHYGDLDEAFAADQLETIIAALAYSSADRAAKRANPTKLVIDGDIYNSLASYRGAVKAYQRFCLGDGNGLDRQADRIRQFALDTVIVPARQRGEPEVAIVAGDVHRSMQLTNAMPAVCSALGSQIFERLADVKIVDRQGPANSSTVRFTYALNNRPSGPNWAEAELRRRYDAPSTDTAKMLGFHLRDGRATALQRDVSGVQLWLEDDPAQTMPPVQTVRHYLAEQPRHSNLPARLKHAPAGDSLPRPVMLASVQSPEELNALLDWYDRLKGAINRTALERLHAVFLAKFPDFASFESSGGYGPEEDVYKRPIIAEARRLLGEHAGAADPVLGGALLDLAASKQHNLLGYFKTYELLKDWRAASGGAFDDAAGALVRSHDEPATAVQNFVDAVWPLMQDGQASKPYGDSRIIATLLLALTRPGSAIFVRTTPFNNAGMMLLGQKLYGWNPLTAQEYRRTLDLSDAVFTVMREDWQWHPRDLWDVQGFLWVTCQTLVTADTHAASPNTEISKMPDPTNLILYGPPGTGKTFATAKHAVRLCGEDAPADRAALMVRYRELSDAGRIRFVTFHQSYAYEDFVEGLRPTTGAEGEQASAGFRLEPVPGVFREIAALADQATRAAAGGTPFDVGNRQVFKMSLGRAGEEDHIFDAAVEGGYVVLGWGGEIDWAPYDDYDAIFARWNQDHPGTHGSDGNISQLWRFRSSMKIGDLVVVSYGNSRYRAIGEITGDYEYAPTGEQDYNHRRKVRWLYMPPEPQPITFYDKPFTMRSCYLLREEYLNRAALALVLPGTGGAPTAPKQFVLICDEINRANISKVFGELITLLEGDKRLGRPNELRVRLPYSGDSFGVPANLHIIGTMNTADRSIALIDKALRRRFTFTEMMPDYDVPGMETEVAGTGVTLAQVLRTINERIEYLLDREHQIGHGWLLGCDTRAKLDAAMTSKIIPLIAEYFFEDWGRTADVLGGRADNPFLRANTLYPPPVLADEAPRTRWSVRPDFAADAYTRLIG